MLETFEVSKVLIIAPLRVARDQAQAAGLSPMMLSFMRESRRLDNTRMKAELGARLRYPEVLLGLRTGEVR